MVYHTHLIRAHQAAHAIQASNPGHYYQSPVQPVNPYVFIAFSLAGFVLVALFVGALLVGRPAEIPKDPDLEDWYYGTDKENSSFN